MKSIRYRRTSQSARRKSVSAILVFLLAAMAGPALWPPRVHAFGFTGGPSVRVSPNDKVEFRWSADVSWRAFVEVFDNPDGTGAPIEKQESVDGSGLPVVSTDHTVTINVGLLQPDTGLAHEEGS